MPHYFEFDVALHGANPPVWRRFTIRTGATFHDLHHAVQDACGWWDYHLFRFETADGSAVAGIPDDDWDQPDPDAAKISISSYFPESSECVYLYDFGDGWVHDIHLRRSLELSEEFFRRMDDGARAFPPEDCGGLGGYENCVAIARGGPDPEGLREWMGDWDPERFDLEASRLEFDSQ